MSVSSSAEPLPEFSFDHLSPLIPPFDFGRTEDDLDPEFIRYLRYYNINISEHMDGVSHKTGWVELEGYRIAIHLFQPANSKGTAFILHGYYDHSGLYSNAFRFWLEKGYSVIAFDLPGHGISSGERVAIKCFSEYRKILSGLLKLSQGELPEPWYLMGQSTGGAIITDYLLKEQISPEQNPVKNVVLLSPLVRPVRWKKAAFQYLLLRSLLKKVPRKFGDNSRDAAFKEFVRFLDPLQSKVIPVRWVGALRRWIKEIESVSFKSDFSPLIIQGDNDATVDWQHNLDILKRLYSAPGILMLPGAGHHLINETSSTREEFFRFISEQLSL